MELKEKVARIVVGSADQISWLNFRVVGVLVLFSTVFLGTLYSTLSSFPPSPPNNGLPALALTSLLLFEEPPAANSEPGRPVFAYSVIPGGVHNAQELRAALKRDPLAAAHYSGFHVERVKLIKLREDRLAYVSYRLGHQIFWSSRKVTLHVGEELLFDGNHLARTRCGNRISMDPGLPVAPAGEPTEATLDRPVVHPNPEISTVAFPFGPNWAPDMPPPGIVSLLDPSPGGSPGGPPVPGGPPIICCSNGAGPDGPGLPPPPISTPEPSTLALLLVAAATLAALTLKRRM